MGPTYKSELYRFNKGTETAELSLLDASLMVRNGEATAVLMDVVDPADLDKWWLDGAFPKVTQHQSFRGAGKSGLSIGPIQRLVKDQLIPGLIDYFSYGGQCNAGLRQTEFAKLCFRELNADSVRVGDWGEMPLVSKREYIPDPNGRYSVPPHCDAIHFGREPDRWPIKKGYEEGYDQLSVFLCVEDSKNSAGLIMWDCRPESRAELDELMGEFNQTGRIQRLDNAPSVTVRPQPGQISVLNTRVMHAVEQCRSMRQTLGSFMVWHDGRWRIFH